MGEIESSKEKQIFGSLLIAIFIVVLVGLVYFATLPKGEKIAIHFLDVGQGDSALIVTPDKQRILIDGGPGEAVLGRLDEYIPFYERRIDAIIVTHPHADHLDGLLSVLDKYEVKTVYLTGVLHTTQEYLDFLEKLKTKNIVAKDVVAGDELELANGSKIEFLFPIKSMVGKRIENLNNSSIVTKLVWEKSAAIFMGDLEKEAQDEILVANEDVTASLIKIPHHGSKDSANEKFIKAVKPQIAVISVGKDNKFGHPSATALEILKSIKVFRTDQDGDVNCQMDISSVTCD